MFGRALAEEIRKRGDVQIESTVEDLDVTDAASVERFLGVARPEVVFNATGYTDVDGAEANPTAAERVNALAPKLISEAAARVGALMVHVGTDYVFDGSRREPYLEEDVARPLSVYARTKLAGEEAVRASGASHLIIRSAWMFAPWGRNFVVRILERARAGEPLRVVDDQRGSPTYAPDLAAAMVDLALSGLSGGARGTFNVVNSGEATWYGLARKAIELAGFGAEVRPISTPEYPSKAARPAYSVLSTAKLERTLKRSLRPWQDALKECIARTFPDGA